MLYLDAMLGFCVGVMTLVCGLSYAGCCSFCGGVSLCVFVALGCALLLSRVFVVYDLGLVEVLCLVSGLEWCYVRKFR